MDGVAETVDQIFDLDNFMDSLMGAVKTSCMINFIIVGAAFLSVAMGYTGIPKQLGQIVNDLSLIHI